jgi:hypothetical protein
MASHFHLLLSCMSSEKGRCENLMTQSDKPEMRSDGK